MTMPIAVLRGRRIVLRGWAPDDAAPFAALNADPIAMEFLPHPLSRDESDAMIGRLQDGLETRGWGLWCLEIDGECGGFVGLSVPRFEAPFTPCTEIGWRLAPKFWGHGYVTEAARLALDFGFQKVGLDRNRLVHHGRQPAVATRDGAHRHGTQCARRLRASEPAT